MKQAANKDKQNITVSLTRDVLRKARILAARRETSISGLLSREIESMVAADDAYEQAQHRALAVLKKGFRLGGKIAPREELHER
jgi:hypothetical protein